MSCGNGAEDVFLRKLLKMERQPLPLAPPQGKEKLYIPLLPGDG